MTTSTLATSVSRASELLTSRLIAVAFLMPCARAFACSRFLHATVILTPELPRISAVGRVTKPAPSNKTDLGNVRM